MLILNFCYILHLFPLNLHTYFVCFFLSHILICAYFFAVPDALLHLSEGFGRFVLDKSVFWSSLFGQIDESSSAASEHNPPGTSNLSLFFLKTPYFSDIRADIYDVKRFISRFFD